MTEVKSVELQPAVYVQSAFVHIENKVSLRSRQIWFYLLYKAFPLLEDNTQQYFRVSIAEVKKFLGYNNKNHKYLREMLEELISCKVQFNIFNKDKHIDDGWLTTTLLASCAVPLGKGYVEYEFSGRMREKLYNPKMYLKLNLLISSQFTNKHALSLYTAGLDFLPINKNYVLKKFSVEDMRLLLGLNPGEYERPTDIDKHIIKKAEEEINEKSDASVTIKTVKKGRKISGWMLSISIKEDELAFYKQKPMKFNNQGKDSVGETRAVFSISDPQLKNFYQEHQIAIGNPRIKAKLKELKQQLGQRLEPYLLYLTNTVKQAALKKNIRSVSGLYVSLLDSDEYLTAFEADVVKEQHFNQQLKTQRQSLEYEQLIRQYEKERVESFRSHLKRNYGKHQSVFVELVEAELETKPSLKNMVLQKSGGEVNVSVLERPMIVSALLKHQKKFGYDFVSFDEWKEIH